MSNGSATKLLQWLRGARERETARALADGNRDEAGERERLEALRSWQEDYLWRQRKQLRKGVITRSQLERWQGFVRQLGNVIESQHGVVTRHEQEVRELEREWRESRVELSAANRLAEREEMRARDEERRREQAEVDEAALHARRPPSAR